MLKPKARFKKVTDIKAEFLLKNGIKGIILDVDNTLIDLKANPVDGIVEWCDNLKENNIKVCIASNSSKVDKISRIAKSLDIPFVYLSWKPCLRGLKKAKKILDLKSNEIAEVGDQLFTDVIGANRMKMFSILTTPVEKEKDLVNIIKRSIEKIFIKKIEFTKE